MSRSLLRKIAMTTSLSLTAVFASAVVGQAAASAAPAKPPGTDGAKQHTAKRHTMAIPAPKGTRHNPLLKEMLAGKNEGQTDSLALSALCQAGMGQPNPYNNPAPNVDQIVGDTIVTVGSQTGCSAAQNENSIAVNPFNPKNIVAGTNDYRVFNSRENRNDSSGWAYTTFDGGQSWANIQLPHLTFQTGATGALSYMDAAGDPAIAFGPHNTVYYANIAFSRAAPIAGGTEPSSAITLNISHDGGLHWGEPVIIAIDGVDSTGTPTPTQIFNDKVWVGSDRFSGAVYVTWTRFADNADGSYLESPIVLAASSNYGASFSGTRRVDVPLAGFAGGITPFSQGSNPQVSRTGVLYIAYEGTFCATLACDGATDHDVTVVATSKDRGLTFKRAVVDTNFDFPLNEPLGTQTLTGENFRVNSFPQLAYDPVFDRLAVTWADDRHGSYDPTTGASIKSNGDNIVSTSGDGKYWSAPKTVGTRQDEVFGAIVSLAGVTAVTSYTRHYDPTGINLDYAYWKSIGKHFSRGPIHRVTTQSSNPQIQFVGLDDEGTTRQGVFIGDYTAAAMGFDFALHPCWTDFRGRPGTTAPNQDSYTDSIRLI
ncbi:MAG: exo-alpha-sialidase [Pseudonocardiales bacterium]|nr:MAG: exo-alpha-sialidase [Pseudonocardiales bacterium]